MTPAADRSPTIVDEFDEPYTRTANLMAVLEALATAKAADKSDGDMWWGIAEMAGRALADVRTMNRVFTQAADHIYPRLEHPRAKPKKGGAR